MIRQLVPNDAAAFRALRLDGFARHPLEFRYTPDDETATTLADTEGRLGRDFVVGAFASDGTLAGIGGLSRFIGAKLRHKALLWGMYVHPSARGQGLGESMVASLLVHARSIGVEIVQLTVMADNTSARRLYERCGFETYGIEPAAVTVRDHDTIRYLDERLMLLRL